MTELYFFLPVQCKPKQSDRSNVFWKWARSPALKRCPFCRGSKIFTRVRGAGTCATCGGQWSNVRDHKAPVVHHRPDDEVKANAQTLAAFAAQYRPREPIAGPVRLDLVFVTEWRGYHKKAARAQGWAWKHTKPDVDNLRKQMGDVLELAGFVKNDAQFCAGDVWSVHSSAVGVHVWLTWPAGKVSRIKLEALAPVLAGDDGPARLWK